MSDLTSDIGLMNSLLAGIDYTCQLAGTGLHTCASCQTQCESFWYLVRTRRRGHYKTLCWKCMIALKRKWIERGLVRENSGNRKKQGGEA